MTVALSLNISVFFHTNVKTLLPTKKTTDVYSASHGSHRFRDKRAL